MGIEAEMRTFREEGLTGLDGGYLKESVVEISSLGRTHLFNKDCEYVNDRNGGGAGFRAPTYRAKAKA